MPDGYSISLDQFKGLNQIGETALRDKVNNHYLKFSVPHWRGNSWRISEAGTAMCSPIHRWTALARDSFESRELLDEILDRFLTSSHVTIREGNRVKIYLSGICYCRTTPSTPCSPIFDWREGMKSLTAVLYSQ